MILKDDYLSHKAYWLAKHGLEFLLFMVLAWLLALSFDLHLEASLYRIALAYLLLKVIVTGVMPKYVKHDKSKGG
jgi:hypothetical protein